MPIEHPYGQLLTVEEVARRLRVDTTTVRRWIKQGVLEAVILPHVNERQAYRIKQSTLDHLLRDSHSWRGEVCSGRKRLPARCVGRHPRW